MSNASINILINLRVGSHDRKSSRHKTEILQNSNASATDLLNSCVAILTYVFWLKNEIFCFFNLVAQCKPDSYSNNNFSR